MPKLIIDNREIEVPEGTKVIEAAERLGIMIPRFCYHPALGAVGACRVCAVMFEEGPVKGVQMSCMVDAKDKMVVSTTNKEAVDFRKYVIEWLMLNHPHDCPVCDEGGHCLLQDETISGGHGIRRYLGKKRTYCDQDLGVFVQHEMNRCIHCWRCRRFYQEFAGYRDLGAMQIGDRTYFGRFENGPLESPFSGNLIDLCPTGVYTDKPARFKTRRWDLERSPSLCLHCSLGCNTIASARYREMIRLEARVNEAVNGHFICDRGRFGFDYANHPDRPRSPRVDGRETTWEEAIQIAARRLGQIVRRDGPGAVACLGSARSSLETQAGLVRLARSQGWPDPCFFLEPEKEQKVRSAVLRSNPEVIVSMGEIEKSDFILLAGADPVNEAPMLALALRQAYRNGATIAAIDPRPLFLPFPFDHLPVPPWHMDLCLNVLVKGALRSEEAAAAVEEKDDYSPVIDTKARLDRLSGKLQESERPVLVCGTDIVREPTTVLIADLVHFLRAANKPARLFYLLPGPNAFGAALLASASEPAAPSVAQALETGAVKALVVAEGDPLHAADNRDWLLEGLDRLELLVVLDYLPSPMAHKAHILLPTLTLFEKEGCGFVNQEGRYQRSTPAHHGGRPISQVSGGKHPPRTFVTDVPGGEPRAAWEVLSDLAAAMGGAADEAGSTQGLWTWLVDAVPALAPIAPQAGGPPDGARVCPTAPPPLGTGPERAHLQGAPDGHLEPQQRARSPLLSAGLASEIKNGYHPYGEDSLWIATGNLQLLIVDSTFGTEELSAYSRDIRQVEKTPELLMQAQDAARLNLSSGETVSIELPEGALSLPLRVHENMAPGVIVMPRHRRLDWQKLKGRPVMIPENGIRKI